MHNLTNEDIIARLKYGRAFVRKFAEQDATACNNFYDPTGLTQAFSLDDDREPEFEDVDDGDGPDSVPQGQSNRLATNLITKNAAITISDPDFHITCQDADLGEIARTFLCEKWRLNDWVRLCGAVQMKQSITGLGVVTYRWDMKYHTCLEEVKSWDLCLDPHLTDWNRVKWAGRRVKMSLREAMERYPGTKFFDSETEINADKKTIEIWVYWDEEEEVHIYDTEVLHRDANHYGAVPMIFYLGIPDPGKSVWPLGDWPLAAGMQTELSEYNAIMSHDAKNGRPINLVQMQHLGDGGQQALEEGREYIPVNDLVTPPIVRIPGTPLEPTLLQAMTNMERAMDAMTGVGQYEKGVIEQKASFATEVAAIANQSGARAVQSRMAFERFVTRIAEITLKMEAEFGGPKKGEELPDELMILWEAVSSVEKVVVIESSTVFKDPQFELQQSMQLVNVLAELTPLFLQTGQEIPNLRQYVDDMLRNSGKNNTQRYWMPNPQVQMQAQMQGQVPAQQGALPQ